MLLLHPPSRALFSREIYMNLLLDLLMPDLPPSVQMNTILVLTTALLGYPSNARVFERVDGLLAVSSLYRDGETTRTVKSSVMEFLRFYLMDETSITSPPETMRRGSGSDGSGTTNSSSSSGSSNSFTGMDSTGTMRRIRGGSGSVDQSSMNISDASLADVDERGILRSTRTKRRMLSNYLSNMDDIVREMMVTAIPFDGQG
jgi:hypothetical protein